MRLISDFDENIADLFCVSVYIQYLDKVRKLTIFSPWSKLCQNTTTQDALDGN